MEVHNQGIFVVSARYNCWSVKVGDRLYVSARVKSLRKYLANPNAKVHCFAEFSFVIQNKINNSHKHRVHGHFDLDTGEFTQGADDTVSVDYVRQQEIVPTQEIPAGVIKAVADHMLDTWRKRFKKEATSG